jgi:hypothetical protein
MNDEFDLTKRLGFSGQLLKDCGPGSPPPSKASFGRSVERRCHWVNFTSSSTTSSFLAKNKRLAPLLSNGSERVVKGLSSEC